MSKEGNIKITTSSNMVMVVSDKEIAKRFWFDGARVEFLSGVPVFGTYFKEYAPPVAPVYPVWFNEIEKDQLIAHWEKTGMFPTIVQKLRAVESTQEIR